MKSANRKAMFSNSVHTKAKAGFHNGLEYTNEFGHTAHHVGKFIVTKDGRVINLNRQSNIYGHDITRRNYDSSQGVSSKNRGHDYNKRVPPSFAHKGVRTSDGKLIKKSTYYNKDSKQTDTT